MTTLDNGVKVHFLRRLPKTDSVKTSDAEATSPFQTSGVAPRKVV